MRPKAISIAAASAAVLVSGIFCSSGNNIISDNIANAEIQTRLLLEASEAGDTIRIPSSFQNSPGTNSGLNTQESTRKLSKTYNTSHGIMMSDS